jgi:membrane fusion protein (multidrug efflux system)
MDNPSIYGWIIKPERRSHDALNTNGAATMTTITANPTGVFGIDPDRVRAALKRFLVTGLGIGLVVGAGVLGHHYYTVGRYLESTDDAYVKADYTTVAPKVAGYVSEVLVADNEKVTAGQVLARIDDRDYTTALDQARGDVAAADAALRNLDAQLVLQQSVIAQQQADIDATIASQKFAQQEDLRYRDLLHRGFGTVQQTQAAEAKLNETSAQLQRARAALVTAQKQLDVIATERDRQVAVRDRDAAIARQAEINLSYTTIVAPVDGTVGARSIRVGQFVAAGTQLMAVVPLQDAYIVANFKETQLAHVRDGAPVDVTVDGFPGAHLTGHVDSLSPASGLEFALLPPDNATGNFTKIVQRIPVKIVLDHSALAGKLRPGMSVEPTIDTRGV